jgi:hypothetical protein
VPLRVILGPGLNSPGNSPVDRGSLVRLELLAGNPPVTGRGKGDILGFLGGDLCGLLFLDPPQFDLNRITKITFCLGKPFGLLLQFSCKTGFASSKPLN